MRARRRQGWWVCAFGVGATAPIAQALIDPAVTRQESALALGYALVVGLVLGVLADPARPRCSPASAAGAAAGPRRPRRSAPSRPASTRCCDHGRREPAVPPRGYAPVTASVGAMARAAGDRDRRRDGRQRVERRRRHRRRRRGRRHGRAAGVDEDGDPGHRRARRHGRRRLGHPRATWSRRATCCSPSPPDAASSSGGGIRTRALTSLPATAFKAVPIGHSGTAFKAVARQDGSRGGVSKSTAGRLGGYSEPPSSSSTSSQRQVTAALQVVLDVDEQPAQPAAERRRAQVSCEQLRAEGGHAAQQRVALPDHAGAAGGQPAVGSARATRRRAGRGDRPAAARAPAPATGLAGRGHGGMDVRALVERRRGHGAPGRVRRIGLEHRVSTPPYGVPQAPGAQSECRNAGESLPCRPDIGSRRPWPPGWWACCWSPSAGAGRAADDRRRGAARLVAVGDRGRGAALVAAWRVVVARDPAPGRGGRASMRTATGCGWSGAPVPSPPGGATSRTPWPPARAASTAWCSGCATAVRRAIPVDGVAADRAAFVAELRGHLRRGRGARRSLVTAMSRFGPPRRACSLSPPSAPGDRCRGCGGGVA